MKRRAAAAFPVVERYEGPEGRAWLAQLHTLVPHLAGATAAGAKTKRFRAPRPLLRGQALAAARSGAFAAIGEVGDEPGRELREAVRFPPYVIQEADLPQSAEALRAGLPGSSLDRDWRRIRNAAMTWRVVDDAELRRFYDEMYRPHIAARHGGTAQFVSFERMRNHLAGGGELLCIDCGGAWVAANYNVRHPGKLVMAWTGSLPGAPPGASAAAYLFSMERAIALGCERIGLGRSLPFLGPGVARYKANWGGAIRRDPYARATARAYIDLARPEMRGLLARHPMIIVDGSELAAVRWIRADGPGPAALAADVERFAGIDRWFFLGAADDLARAAQGHPRIQQVPVGTAGPASHWLGDCLAGLLRP